MRELTYSIAELLDVQGTINHHVGNNFANIPPNSLTVFKSLHDSLGVIIHDLTETNNALKAD